MFVACCLFFFNRRASQRWARLSENEKRPSWHNSAEQKIQAHKEAFPEYRYCPRKLNSVSIFAIHRQQQENSAFDDGLAVTAFNQHYESCHRTSSSHGKFNLSEEKEKEETERSDLVEKRAKRRLMVE